MKYWLFDGEDVIGPFTPQEITARVGFSDSILVCPEEKSEDENAWQTAANFEDFTAAVRTLKEKKDRETGAQNAKSPAAQKTSPKENTKVPLAITSVPISHAEEEEPVLSLNKTEEDAPATTEKTVPPTTKQPTAEPTTQAEPTAAPKETAADKPAPQTDNPAAAPLSKNKIDPGLWPELSLHSLPILGVSENTLPPLPAGDITFYVPGKEPAVWNQPEMPAPQTEQPAKQNEAPVAKKETPAKEVPPVKATPAAQKQEPAKQPTANQSTTPPKATVPADKSAKKQPAPVQKKPARKAPAAAKPQKAFQAPLPAAIPDDAPEDFFAQTLSPFTQIPKELVQEQDQEAIARIIQNPIPAPQEHADFIPQTTAAAHSGKRFLLFIVAFLTLVLLLAIGGCWWARARKTSHSRRTVQPATAVTQTLPAQASVSAKQDKPSAKETRPDIPVPPPPTVRVSPLQEKALAIAKNYLLPTQHVTVENYLNKLYAVQLSQGYEGAWSAEPLHKSTYIVKYRLTKTRTEPVVYVFQVDTSTGKLTGALNNITLDLVGKI